MDYSTMKFSEVAALPGVKDIKPTPARGAFAHALIAESKGDHVKAAEYLNKAVSL